MDYCRQQVTTAVVDGRPSRSAPSRLTIVHFSLYSVLPGRPRHGTSSTRHLRGRLGPGVYSVVGASSCPSRIPNSLAECRAKATLRAADRVPYAVACMEAVVLTLLHLAVTAAKLCRPGGVRAVIAENLLLKQQLIVLRRPRKRAPNLTTVDRVRCV